MRTKSVPTITIDDIKEVADVCKKHGVQSYHAEYGDVWLWHTIGSEKIVNTCKEEWYRRHHSIWLCSLWNMQNRGYSTAYQLPQTNVTNVESSGLFFSPFEQMSSFCPENWQWQVKPHHQEIKRKIRGFQWINEDWDLIHGALCMAVWEMLPAYMRRMPLRNEALVFVQNDHIKWWT